MSSGVKQPRGTTRSRLSKWDIMFSGIYHGWIRCHKLIEVASLFLHSFTRRRWLKFLRVSFFCVAFASSGFQLFRFIENKIEISLFTILRQLNTTVFPPICIDAPIRSTCIIVVRESFLKLMDTFNKKPDYRFLL
jgi:hypothetical protein